MPIDLLLDSKRENPNMGILNRRIVIVAETHRDESCFSDVDAIKRGFEDDDRSIKVYVQEDYPIYGQDKGKVSNTCVTTNLVIPLDDDTDMVSGTPAVYYTLQ